MQHKVQCALLHFYRILIVGFVKAYLGQRGWLGHICTHGCYEAGAGYIYYLMQYMLKGIIVKQLNNCLIFTVIYHG